MHSIVSRFTRPYSPSSRICRFLTSSTTTSDDITKLSLRKSIPNKFSPLAKDDFIEDKDTKITTLKNGLRIASQDRFGAQCAMGASFKDRNEVQAFMEECNAIFDCQISSSSMDRLVHSLADTVIRPRITTEEVEMAELSIGFELEAMQRTPPVDPIIQELVHGVAYRGNGTIGLPRFCPPENLGQITRDHIINFVATYYKPERMVFAGVGIDHDALVKSVEKAFTPFEHSLSGEPAAQNAPLPDTSAAQYTGGYAKVERDLSQYHAPMPEFAHAALAFESCGYQDPKFVPACLLHSLLGGGGSFSAGGPGKGMYTRLYVNVLNEHHWINSAQAENHSYADTGLFIVSGSSAPAHLDRLVHTLIAELRSTAESDIPSVELARAKSQLKSMLLMNLETRAVTFEDIARQVLTTGKRRQPEYWADKIANVKTSDLHDLLHQMLTYSPVTVAGFGRVDQLPSHDQVQKALTRPLGSLRAASRLPNLFRRFQR